MKRINKVLLILITVCSLFLTACGKTNLYRSTPSDYLTISNIDNLAFDIPLNFSNKATSLTTISNDKQYERNQIYSFKNGYLSYIFFGIDQIVVIAQKGTFFNFAQTEDKVSCLENSGVFGTWFSKSGKKFFYSDAEKDGIYKIIADVNAEVVVTSEVYNDFTGKLAVISDGNTEWGLFVGVPGNSLDNITKEQKKFIDNVSASMRIQENYIEPEETFDVVINQTLDESEVNEEIKELVIEEDIVKTETTSEETSISNEDSTDMQEDDSSISEQVSTPQPTIAPEIMAQTQTDKSVGLNITNQKNTKNINPNEARFSNEYYMLSVGESGIYNVFDSRPVLGMIWYPIIRINNIYTGESAIRIIQKELEDAPYEYFDAPDGYSWHVAQYDISLDQCAEDIYTDIRLVGVDGNSLVYRGIKCPQRTHDANYHVKIDGCNRYNMYCYYAVPNGCKEYALKIGDAPLDDGIDSRAYYYINVK